MTKTDILSLSFGELSDWLAEAGEPKFRAKQIFTWLHSRKATDFSEMTDLSLSLRTKLSDSFCINRLIVVKRLESSIDNTVKYLYGLSDGSLIESVLMAYKHGDSLCVSTQVGCKMGCNFCASTIAGFVRNLTPGEMLGQIYEAERDSGRTVSSLVLMGIGEPLDNYDNVLKFLRLLSAPQGRGMSLRHVTLSTCGLVPMIDRLAEEGLGLTLSVSLHAADDASRSRIMPVNRKYSIAELLGACRRYFATTGRRITFEYAVIDGVNGTREQARLLAKHLEGLPCHINLIPVNPVRERNYHTKRDTVYSFQQMLEQEGLNATVRRTLGSDINAACGQLRREAQRERGEDIADSDSNGCRNGPG